MARFEKTWYELDPETGEYEFHFTLKTPPPNDRREILRQAEKYISGARNEDYGTAEKNFNRIAKLWEAYRDNGEIYTPADVAAMMILLKTSRLHESPNHLDSWTDIAGYAALGGETSCDA